MPRSAALVALAFLVMGVAMAGQAETDPAEPVLRLRAGFVELARRSWPPAPADVAALIERGFDLARVTRTVLGRYADTASAAQQARLAHALALRLARESLRYRPDDAADGFAVVERRPIGATEWLVMTRALLPARADPAAREPVVLGWRVSAGEHGLRIVDVLRDGISAVSTERDDLAAALARRDLDSVIAEIERRAAAPSPAR